MVNSTPRILALNMLFNVTGIYSHGADSENIDFAAPLKLHRFNGIFCFSGPPAKNITPFKKCLKDHWRTISAGQF